MIYVVGNPASRGFPQHKLLGDSYTPRIFLALIVGLILFNLFYSEKKTPDHYLVDMVIKA